MKAFIVLAALGLVAGAVAWAVIVVRKYRERKVFEREREAQFMAEMRRVQPAVPKTAAPAAAQAVASDPLSAATATIRTALAAGRGPDAARAFLAVLAERTKLTLEPPVWEGLGRALLAQGSFMEAAWALHAGAALAGDLPGAQKRLVEVAVRAGDAGQAQNALKLYATLLSKYPQSQYADFVRTNMKEQEKKLPKGPAS